MRLPFAALCPMCVLGLLAAASANAQPLGTFRWQLQPFCNVVVVNVTQQGAIYHVDGFDDQCGAGLRAPLVGTATPNPDGTIGFGLNLVTAPSGRGVQLEARISLPGLSGPWTDSFGNKGTFAFGANTGGPARELTGFGALAVNPAQVQLRVVEACVTGQVIQRIGQDGSVTCAPGLKSAQNGGLDASDVGGLVSNVPLAAAGTLPASGPGKRFLWYPGKAALRAGQVDGTEWDDANIGQSSVATGFDTVASGARSVAMGTFTVASGRNSVAMGASAVASGAEAVAMGFSTTAGGDGSVALGAKAVTLAAARGSFVFADGSSGSSFTSFVANQFLARASGGVGFYTNAATTTGVELAPNGSSWASLSDVNAKENFRDVNGEDVLAKLAAMSIQEWNYKAQDAGIRHIGPTAQEFRAAFGLGDFPLRINTIDADGVALAAVKALEARTRRLNETLQRENDELRARLQRLEELLRK